MTMAVLIGRKKVLTFSFCAAEDKLYAIPKLWALHRLLVRCDLDVRIPARAQGIGLALGASLLYGGVFNELGWSWRVVLGGMPAM
jgi:hypothetical protein